MRARKTGSSGAVVLCLGGDEGRTPPSNMTLYQSSLSCVSLFRASSCKHLIDTMQPISQIILPYISFIFIEIKFIHRYLCTIFIIKFMSICTKLIMMRS